MARTNLKHIGMMDNTGSRIAVAFKTVPGEPENALVLYPSSLPSALHDYVMTSLESQQGQDAVELGDYLGRRAYHDGKSVLVALHEGGHIKKVPTSQVTMTPGGKTQIPLKELNDLIAEQKGITLAEHAGDPGKPGADQMAMENTASLYSGVETGIPVTEDTLDGRTVEILDAPGEAALTNEVLAANLVKQSAALAAQVEQLMNESKSLMAQAQELNPELATKKKATKPRAKK